MFKKSFKIFSGSAALFAALYAAVFMCFYAALPCNISAEKNAEFSGSFSAATLKQSGGGCAYFLGNVPIKRADISYQNRPRVVLGGMPFGIKIRSDGVMVISVEEKSPARKAGIRSGDVIVRVNGREVSTNSEIAEAVQLSASRTDVILRRNDSEMSLSFAPENDLGTLKIGAWVRDSAAGIGTLTFWEPESGVFGGLGHSVSDVTTGGVVPLKEGEITAARIYDVVRGREGSAGELCGVILPESDMGVITENTSTGIYGTLSCEIGGETVPAAFRQEVQTGAATILTTLDGCEPEEYSIEIERINLLDLNGSKAMVIRITDSGLLEKTGGIVRGMSGSPIIQNGRFVGAVTHVLVNDPTRGYAVFAETMLESCSGDLLAA